MDNGADGGSNPSGDMLNDIIIIFFLFLFSPSHDAIYQFVELSARPIY
jgi:hypothetical protein